MISCGRIFLIAKISVSTITTIATVITNITTIVLLTIMTILTTIVRIEIITTKPNAGSEFGCTTPRERRHSHEAGQRRACQTLQL